MKITNEHFRYALSKNPQIGKFSVNNLELHSTEKSTNTE